MGEVMFSVELMKIGYTLMPPLIIFYIVISFVKNEVVKCILLFLKALAYFGLAYIMFKFYNGRENIDMISLFTFIFCCFEATDNFISLISVFVEYVRETRNGKNNLDMSR